MDIQEKEEEKKVVLVFFETEDTLDNLISIIEEIYMHQPFVIIFTNKDLNVFQYEIKKKINEELDDDFLPYFDMDNIFVHKNNNEGYKKVILSIIKVYRYFNQLGDSFFKQLPQLIDMENIDKEIQHLSFTHYFNILLCGRTGTGKSTFINKIMGEKKSFTLKYQSAGTYRNNYYIHKKYPIKIIDVCGFAEGNEGKETQKKLNAIFNQDINDIIIDEPMNDIFTFYGDKRNNIHLLLYFTVYKDKYDILPGELPIIFEARDHNIPIIFIVNKCADELFEKPKKRKILDKEIEMARKNTDFKDYKTFYINCITKRGFDELLEGIYEQFKKNIISDQNLEKLKNGTMEQEAFNELFKTSFFFGNIKPEDVFLNESITNSVRDIKLLVVKIAGYYYNELGFWKSIGFYLFTKIYNSYKKNADTNFFPILTNLIQTIYSNFGYDKTLEECNNFIKNKISEYFNINVQLEKHSIENKKTGIKAEKEDKNNEKENKEKEKKEDKEKEDKEKEDKEKEDKEKEDNEEEDDEEEEGNEKEDNEEKGLIESKDLIVDSLPYSPPKLSITPETPQNKKEEEEEIEEEEINTIINELLQEDVAPIAYKFTIEQFQKDFINIGKLFWNSELNFQISDNIEEYYLKNGKGLEENVFSFDDKNSINPAKIIQLVKKDFGIDASPIQATEREKIVLILFYISYTCNELISALCGKINEEGFKYKSIYNFYYIVSKLYNNAIMIIIIINCIINIMNIVIKNILVLLFKIIKISQN